MTPFYKLLLAAGFILFVQGTNAPQTNETIAVSPTGDKIVIVQTTLETDSLLNRNKRDNNLKHIVYSLVEMDLKTERTRILSRFDDDETGIHHLLWSPDGKWISFETYSINGHSPLTTNRTWVVDSGKNELQKIELPGKFNDFSNNVINWISDNRLSIQSMMMENKNNQWITTEKKFVFNCKLKKIEE